MTHPRPMADEIDPSILVHHTHREEPDLELPRTPEVGAGHPPDDIEDELAEREYLERRGDG